MINEHMHEVFIAQRIIEKAKEQGSVKKIIIEVGDLAGLPAEDLEAKLKEMTGWKIETRKMPAAVQCRCGFKGAPKITEKEHDVVLFECPKCQKIPKILSGEDIVLKEVIVE